MEAKGRQPTRVMHESPNEFGHIYARDVPHSGLFIYLRMKHQRFFSEAKKPGCYLSFLPLWWSRFATKGGSSQPRAKRANSRERSEQPEGCEAPEKREAQRKRRNGVSEISSGRSNIYIHKKPPPADHGGQCRAAYGRCASHCTRTARRMLGTGHRGQGGGGWGRGVGDLRRKRERCLSAATAVSAATALAADRLLSALEEHRRTDKPTH